MHGEGINRRAGSSRKTVVDCDSLRDAIQGTASLAGCHSWDTLRDAIREVTIFRPLHARLYIYTSCIKQISNDDFYYDHYYFRPLEIKKNGIMESCLFLLLLYVITAAPLYLYKHCHITLLCNCLDLHNEPYRVNQQCEIIRIAMIISLTQVCFFTHLFTVIRCTYVLHF